MGLGIKWVKRLWRVDGFERLKSVQSNNADADQRSEDFRSPSKVRELAFCVATRRDLGASATALSRRDNVVDTNAIKNIATINKQSNK